jgi:hypothetical protein
MLCVSLYLFNGKPGTVYLLQEARRMLCVSLYLFHGKPGTVYLLQAGAVSNLLALPLQR